MRQARDVGLEPLVEAHDARELDAALGTDSRLIGINNRDLRTLAVDPETAVRLRDRVPADRLVVAESGVRETATIRRWRAVFPVLPASTSTGAIWPAASSRSRF